eukprot:442978-Pyramimonas_sp.AAC.1
MDGGFPKSVHCGCPGRMDVPTAVLVAAVSRALGQRRLLHRHSHVLAGAVYLGFPLQPPRPSLVPGHG